MQDHVARPRGIQASEYDVNHVPIRDGGRMIGLHLLYMYLGDRIVAPPTTTLK